MINRVDWEMVKRLEAHLATDKCKKIAQQWNKVVEGVGHVDDEYEIVAAVLIAMEMCESHKEED